MMKSPSTHSGHKTEAKNPQTIERGVALNGNKIRLSLRAIDIFDRFFRKYTPPLSRVDSRMKRFEETSEPNNRNYWDSSQYWSLEYEKAYRDGLSRFGKVQATVAGKTILEIGCGLGGVLCAYRDHGASTIVGVDTDVRRIRFARDYAGTRPQCHFLGGDGMVLPFRNASFDLVVSESTFEHFKDPMAVLREIARVLRPGGLFATEFCTPYHSQWHHNNWEIRIPWPDRLFGEDTLMEYLRWKYQGFPNKSLREFRMLNGLTVRAFQRMARVCGLQEIASRTEGAHRAIAQIPISAVPFLRKISWKGRPLGERKIAVSIYFPFLIPFPCQKHIFPGYYQGVWRKP